MKNLAAVGALALALFACFGTETENPEIGLRGRLVNVEGSPVLGVRVTAFAIDAGLEGPVDSARTDAGGNFLFRGLDAASYNLFGDYLNGTLVVLIPDVAYPNPDSIKNLGTDTLRSPGSIRVQVYYQGSPLPDFYAYLSRTSFEARSDSAGFLHFTGLPRGKYELVYYTQNLGLPYNRRDSVEVFYGRDTVLSREYLDSLPAFSATPMYDKSREGVSRKRKSSGTTPVASRRQNAERIQSGRMPVHSRTVIPLSRQ
jgi:hypothetical protein